MADGFANGAADLDGHGEPVDGFAEAPTSFAFAAPTPFAFSPSSRLALHRSAPLALDRSARLEFDQSAAFALERAAEFAVTQSAPFTADGFACPPPMDDRPAPMPASDAITSDTASPLRDSDMPLDAIRSRTSQLRRADAAQREAESGAAGDPADELGSEGHPNPTPGAPLGTAAFGDAGDPARMLARLRKALRRERARGRSGHWTYDLSRHLALAQDVRKLEATLRAALFARPAPLAG